MRIYLASSWRNPYQPNVVELLRGAGHEVYDFRHPPGGDHLGFSWGDVDPEWRSWDVDRYLAGLQHPIAVAGFESDFGAMQWADAGVVLLPCGRSAHLEAGWLLGQGKPLWIVLDEAELPVREAVFGHQAAGSNPELMYRMATGIVRDAGELVERLACPERSSITDLQCTLPAGHDMWSATRFHRFPLRGINAVRSALHEFYPKPEEVDAWLEAPHPLLGGSAAEDLVGTQREGEVWAVIEQLQPGAVV